MIQAQSSTNLRSTEDKPISLDPRLIKPNRLFPYDLLTLPLRPQTESVLLRTTDTPESVDQTEYSSRNKSGLRVIAELILRSALDMPGRAAFHLARWNAGSRVWADRDCTVSKPSLIMDLAGSFVASLPFFAAAGVGFGILSSTLSMGLLYSSLAVSVLHSGVAATLGYIRGKRLGKFEVAQWEKARS